MNDSARQSTGAISYILRLSWGGCVAGLIAGTILGLIASIVALSIERNVLIETHHVVICGCLASLIGLAFGMTLAIKDILAQRCENPKEEHG